MLLLTTNLVEVWYVEWTRKNLQSCKVGVIMITNYEDIKTKGIYHGTLFKDIPNNQYYSLTFYDTNKKGNVRFLLLQIRSFSCELKEKKPMTKEQLLNYLKKSHISFTLVTKYYDLSVIERDKII